MGKICRSCGKPISPGAKGDVCRECSRKLAQQRHEREKNKAIKSREQKGVATVLALNQYWGKEKCVKCGHGFRYDTSFDVACGYIVDASSYQLPPRPRPSADPRQCLYFSKLPSQAGMFTEEEKLAIYDEGKTPVILIDTCTVYKDVYAASEQTGEDAAEIKAECESTDDINALRRWRYLKAEEKLLLRPQEGAGRCR